MKTKQTELPWRIESGQIVDNRGMLVFSLTRTDAAKDETRRRIVRAVNSHAALLEACKKAEASFRAFANSNPINALSAHSEEAQAADMADELQAAITQAESE